MRWLSMRFDILADLTYDFPIRCETLLLIEAAQGPDQLVVSETLTIDPDAAVARLDDDGAGERRAVLDTAGRVRIQYAATVDVQREDGAYQDAGQVAIRDLPHDALAYLRPSRFCPSDRFERFAAREFGTLSGGARVAAMVDWIGRHLDYQPGVSNSGTTALDTFVDRAGVCRDFAHLAISICRASDIPARAVSAYAWRLEPPDLHAVAEVYLGDRWWLVDPTGKAPVSGLVRVAAGRDAADIAFMSVFGTARLVAQAFAIAEAGGVSKTA
ncbi:transglutaminase family protein [Phenylobacterium sp. J367]|uniref:transglutaminase-like domain-containing protein n=1 Tax=Phenylobacterium sp. J367 TaxID=2898435 RepID=UPI002150DEAF|nr:transglutaminase family protein [Phenylobacterium sp. J367]MCR5881128.1 transglutaminase family protein [Phenylobacterium sp. J367]